MHFLTNCTKCVNILWGRGPQGFPENRNFRYFLMFLGEFKMTYRELVGRFPAFRGRRLHISYSDVFALCELRIAHPNLSKSELSRRSGLSRPTVRRLLRILETSRG